MPFSKISLLKAGFIMIILGSFLSCKKSEPSEKANNEKDVLLKKNKEEIVD